MHSHAQIFPAAINRACALFIQAPEFTQIPDGFIRIVLNLVKKIDLKRPTSPIFASRSTIASESGKSVETVQRAVKWLEDQGLILREQKARRGLRGSSSPIIPTEKFLAALYLTVSQLGEDSKRQFQTPKKRSGPQEQSYLLPGNTESSGEFKKIGSIKLPIDLAWLVLQRGLRATAVLHLMKLAKVAGYKLSDLVRVTGKYLQELHGREIYAYLRALIGKGKDFSQSINESVVKDNEQMNRQFLKEKSEAMAGRSYRSKDGTRIIRVDECGMLIEVHNGVRIAKPLCMKFLDAIEKGRFVGFTG